MDAPDFWTQQKEEIVKYAIRTNYYQEYNEMQLLGEGSFSKVRLLVFRLWLCVAVRTGRCMLLKR
jgi:hypothetical protein